MSEFEHRFNHRLQGRLAEVIAKQIAAEPDAVLADLEPLVTHEKASKISVLGLARGLAPLFDIERAVEHLTEKGDLTPVQSRIVHLLFWGFTDHEIGEHLNCSRRMAKYYVREALHRIGARSRFALLDVLMREDGLEPPKVNHSRGS